MSLDRIVAPWTAEQVASLNKYQATAHVHPYTCGGTTEDGGPYCGAVLEATPEGWRCPKCSYTQDWAWSWA